MPNQNVFVLTVMSCVINIISSFVKVLKEDSEFT
jgi:hypothetical protein